MDNGALNMQLDSLSDDEVEHVMQFRASQASPFTPARRFAWLVSLLAVWVILVIVAVAFKQGVEINNHGLIGEIPAPLSWLFTISVKISGL
jgi:hypothetical protein